MSWVVEGKSVVELPRSFTIEGQKALGGVIIQCHLDLRINGWPEDDQEHRRPLALLLRPVLCRFRASGRELPIAPAQPVTPHLLQVPPDPSSFPARYDVYVGKQALTELEEVRNAGPIHLELCLGAVSLIAPKYSEELDLRTIGPCETHTEWIGATIPKEDWIKVLEVAGFAETLLFEVPLPRTDKADVERARLFLRRALERRLSGSPADVIADSRKVFDALEQGGFGNKAPKDVATFLQDKARKLNMEERFSVLHLALKIFASPAHHAHIDGEDFTRADADMALMLAAALVKLAPIRSTRQELEVPDDRKEGDDD